MDGTKLRELRKRKKLSQGRMAKILGVSKTGYVNWELGDYDPKISVVIKMAKYFEVTIGELVNEKTTNLSEEEKAKLSEAAKIMERISK